MSTQPHTVGCFSDAQLRNLAEQPNVTVMQAGHDTIFEPWPSDRVQSTIQRLVTLAFEHPTLSDEHLRDRVKADDAIREFASKYQVFFDKLTTREFIKVPENVQIVLKLVQLRAEVERGCTSAEMAQAKASDIALTALAKRAKKETDRSKDE